MLKDSDSISTLKSVRSSTAAHLAFDDHPSFLQPVFFLSRLRAGERSPRRAPVRTNPLIPALARRRCHASRLRRIGLTRYCPPRPPCRPSSGPLYADILLIPPRCHASRSRHMGHRHYCPPRPPCRPASGPPYDNPLPLPPRCPASLSRRICSQNHYPPRPPCRLASGLSDVHALPQFQ